MQAQGITTQRYLTYPTIFNNILWYGVAEGDTAYYYAMYSLLDSKPEIPSFQVIPKGHELLKGYENERDIEILKWFSKDYYNVLQKSDGTLQMNNLCFGGIQEKITSEKVNQTIERINEALKDKEVEPRVRQKLNYAKRKWPAALDKYEQQEKIMGDKRNSYSKTDPDATFMRMKEDHMNNGQLKPGYNVQISSNNQIITNYDTFPNPTDTLTLPAHIESFKELYGQAPVVVTADSGYGSEQNYEYLQANDCTAYVKYNYFHQEQQGERIKKYPFAADHLFYNKEQDFYVCPMGQRMENIGNYAKENNSGFEQSISRYQAKNCNGCPLRGVCHKAKGNRIIEINHNANKHKHNARELLTSEEGIAHRKQRAQDVEPIFGNIKQNKGFRRFMLRGKQKVTAEFGLLAIAHNLMKKAA